MRLKKLLSVLLVLYLFICPGCRLLFQDDEESYPAATGNSSISGTINKAASPSLRANGQPANNAKVWLEQRPELFAFTDSGGKYLISGIPAGVFKVVVKFSQGTTVFKLRSVDTLVNNNENVNCDLTVVEAKNIVRGTLKNEDGSTLAPGTKLYLWGEEFEVNENGSFETPPLPDFANIEEAENEIIINYGLSSQIKLPVTFGNGGQTQRVDFFVPATPDRMEHLPRASLINISSLQSIGEVFPNSNSKIMAVIFPESPDNIEWKASRGTFGQTNIIKGNRHERIWTSSEEAGIATLSVLLTYAGKTISSSLQIKIKGLPAYTVDYSGNANTSGIAPIDEISYLAESKVMVAANSGNLAKTGFKFSGWNTKADGSGITYATGATFLMGSNDITLYAKWVQETLVTCTVSFDQNGGSTAPNPDKIVVISGEKVTSLPGAPSKTGHIFSGWNTKADGTGTEVNTSTEITADFTAFAIYNINLFSLNYAAGQNGSISGSSTQTIAYSFNGAPVTAVPATGYKFTGWSDGKTDNPRTDSNVTANINVNASFAPINADVNASNRFAYSENSGWVNFSSDSGKVTAKIVENGYLSGFAWGENIGWIKLAASSATAPFVNDSSSNWGVNVSVDGKLSGYAWSETSGWINFGATNGNAAINQQTGELSGYVWSENTGWIKLSGSSYKVQFGL